MHIRHASMLALLAGCAFHASAPGEGDAAQIGDPIAMDSQSSATTSNSMTLTWSHTVGPGLTRSLLVVGLSIEKTSGASVESITYAGMPLTKAGAASATSGVKAELWYLTAPAAGADNVAVTFTKPLSTDGAVGGAISLSGVDQTTPVPTTATNGGDGMPSTTITTVNDGAWIIDAIMIDNGNAVAPADAGRQSRWSTAQGSLIRGAGSTVATTMHGATTTSWASTSDKWAQVVAELKP
jgi:hypothetical protein